MARMRRQILHRNSELGSATCLFADEHGPSGRDGDVGGSAGDTDGAVGPKASRGSDTDIPAGSEPTKDEASGVEGSKSFEPS